VFVISMLCMSASGATVGVIKYYLTNSEGQLGNFFVGCLTFYLVATAWWAARRKDGETSIFDWAGLLVALSIGAAMVISGLEAAYGHTSLKHDLPVAPYFVFGALALLSAAGDAPMLVRGEVSGTKTHCATPLADVCCLFYRRRFVFPGTAKGNAGEYTRFEAANRAAAADTDIVGLLAVSHVVHKCV
jgi:hypothetical protein